LIDSSPARSLSAQEYMNYLLRVQVFVCIPGPANSLTFSLGRRQSVARNVKRLQNPLDLPLMGRCNVSLMPWLTEINPGRVEGVRVGAVDHEVVESGGDRVGDRAGLRRCPIARLNASLRQIC